MGIFSYLAYVFISTLNSGHNYTAYFSLQEYHLLKLIYDAWLQGSSIPQFL